MNHEPSPSHPSRLSLSIDAWAVLIAFVIAALIRANLFPSIGW
jgi:hypothetical protein